jgi:hypothetical protein
MTYSVIARDFYREHEPMIFDLNTDSIEQAAEIINRKDDIKEILDIKPSHLIEWNNETVNKYWSLYK